MSGRDPTVESSVPQCPSNSDLGAARCRRVDVVSGSRLHFGLLSTRPVDGVCFGGCGLMIRSPVVHVRAVAAKRFLFHGPFDSRCREVVQRLVEHFDLPTLPAADLRLLKAPEAHAGLGSGTQINLAIAAALTTMLQRPVSMQQLAADIASRGRRSAIGVHGFANGGFIAESGIPQGQSLGTLQTQHRFPSRWRILLVRPRDFQTHIHGGIENSHFARLPNSPAADRDKLLTMINHQILPAVREQDFDAFCESVAQYNYASGMLFAAVQGGAYNGPQLESLVALLRRRGCRGIGQSSWGPTIFAFFPDRAAAESMQAALQAGDDGRQLTIRITQARNKPASICADADSTDSPTTAFPRPPA